MRTGTGAAMGGWYRGQTQERHRRESRKSVCAMCESPFVCTDWYVTGEPVSGRGERPWPVHASTWSTFATRASGGCSSILTTASRLNQRACGVDVNCIGREWLAWTLLAGAGEDDATWNPTRKSTISRSAPADGALRRIDVCQSPRPVWQASESEAMTTLGGSPSPHGRLPACGRCLGRCGQPTRGYA